jgi:hypothetical protein
VARKRGVALDVLIAGATRYANERAGEDEKYTKHPTTSLRAGCWDDEPDNRWPRRKESYPGEEADVGYYRWKQTRQSEQAKKWNNVSRFLLTDTELVEVYEEAETQRTRGNAPGLVLRDTDEEDPMQLNGGLPIEDC